MNQVLDTNEDENKKGENKNEGFKMAFRRKLFQIYFELMKERNIDQIFAAVMLIINFVQIYGLLFNHKIEFPFRDDIYGTITTICDIVRVYPLIEDVGVFIIIFMLISFFYNESRPYHTDAFARLDTNFETYITLYKVLICIATQFLYQQKLHWLIIAMHICGSINFCKMYLKYIPYYNGKTSVLFGSGWFIYFWISLNVLLTKALEQVNYQGQSIVILIGIVLIYPATYQIRERKIQSKVFNKKHDKIKSEYELDIFIHKLYRLIIDQHVNEVDEMILLGIVHNHQSECLNNECPLNNSEELYLPLTDSISDRKAIYSKDPILLYHLINSIYAEYAKSSNSTAVLHTTYAYFLFYQIGNIHTALLELNVAEKCDTNFQQKFTIYRSKRFIENYLVNKFGKGKDQSGKQSLQDLDVTIVITFESLFAKLNKEIEKSANDHIEFWSHLDSQMVDLNVLHKLGLNIITNNKRINEIWHQLTKINPNYPKALQMYGSYLVQIKNDNTEGDEFLTQAQQMSRPKSVDEHINDFELMFADDTAIVVISGNKDTQAKIMKTNNGITKLFKYNTFEVHGHEVNILMPPIIGVKHNYFLEQFFKTGRERVINSGLDSFAMLRVGHIFAVSLVIKPVPSLKNDIQYIGLIKPTMKDYDFILTDQYGRIDSISAGITSILQLQASFFKENEIFIQVLCPQLCEIEKVRKGKKEVATKFELWTGLKDLTFIIPRNFSNLSQKTGGRGGGNLNLPINTGINYDIDDDSGINFKDKEQSFIGVKSPDHLKKVCNMFRNNDFKNQPQKYLQTLKNNINYENPEIQKGPIKTEIINRSHGNGYLQMKVFKILNPKRAGTNDDSDSEREYQAGQGDRNLKAMLEEATRKMASDDMTSDELLRRIQTMKLVLINLKKGQRHASLKVKASNITTARMYEKAEMQKYEKEIKELEDKMKELRKKESIRSDMDSEEGNSKKKKTRNEEFLLGEHMDVDFNGAKRKYPLRENIDINQSIQSVRPNFNDVSANDLSAFHDESLMQEKALMGNRDADICEISDSKMGDESKGMGSRGQNARLFEKEEDDMSAALRAKQKDEGEKLDLLKDIRKKQQSDAKKKNKKEEGKEETEGGEGTKEGQGDPATNEGTEEGEDEKFLEEDTGSVASSTKSLMKHLRMLRNALYENYSPPSIRNLKLQAKFVFIALLIIAIIWYIFSSSIYNELKDNIQNIHSSKNRISSLTDIGSDVRVLTFIQQGRVNKTRGGRNYEDYKRQNLRLKAQILQQAQNNLSETYLLEKFQIDNTLAINPQVITLIYNSPSSLPSFYYVDVWSSMMDVAVHAYSITDLPLKSLNINHTSVFFVLINTLNNILEGIQYSTDALLRETQHLSDAVKFKLFILLCVASGSLFISVCLIFPVATKVDNNKDELLRHFMLIDREDVKRQLEKCRAFFNSMHDKEHVTQQNMGDIDEDELKDEEGKEGEEGADGQQKHKKGRQRSRKNKMHKKFSTNFLSLIIKFLVVVSIMEGYFLLCYFQAGSFLKIANSLINEQGTITLRQFSNNFLYQIMQEVLTTNARAQIKNQDSLNFMFQYLNTTIKEQEQFLKTHSNNAVYHSTSFNTFFDQLIYQNVCDAIYQNVADIYDACQQFMGGILKKGLYSANVAYWDNMRAMATDFNNSARDTNAINTIVNSDRLIDNENLKDVYFYESFVKLLASLDSSIFERFDQKDREDTILFASYIVILFILYFVLWRKFIEATRHSLWVTKSMLAIIPLDIIQKVPKIKDFLLASSKNTLSAFKD